MAVATTNANNVNDIMHELESLGSEQTRKTYKRHGAGDNLYGVSFADFGKLVKRIKTDHQLALDLWASGNYDARILATMIDDPQAVTESQIDSWMADITNYTLTDALNGLIAKTRFVQTKMEQWTRSDEEWRGTVGWQLLGYLAMQDKTLPDEYFERYLQTIKREVHASKNRVRYSMNTTIIAIGLRSPNLQEKAIATARKIGKVDVDHGDTSCKTPDAEAYILKSVARQQEREMAAAAKKR